LGVRDDKSGFKNGATWGNFYWFGAAVFHSEKIHGDMAQDVRSGLAQESADLIIVVAGSPHLPGLSQQLENDFKDCQKIVVSNPNTRVPSEPERIHFDATPEALGRIGTLTKFEIDPQNNNRVTVPPAIAAAIESKSELKSVVSAMEQTDIITSGDEGAIDGVRMNDFQNLQKASSPAPIIFLLGTSTAGKSTICEEIERQDGLSEKLGFETWGVDLEFDNEVARCRKFLQDDERFLAIKDKFPHPWKIIAGIYLGEVKDSETGDILNVADDEKFADNVDNFLAKTGARYDKEALEILKTLTQENPNNFRERADLTNEGMSSRAFERAVDHAIENSKNGKPTILDMVPNSEGGDMVAAFEKRLVERNFTCPTRVALVHLSVADLTERMDQRNQKALAAGGNPNDQRNGIFPFQQYAAIFGAIAEEGSHGLGTLHSDDVHKAVEKFGDKNDAAIRDREGKELLDRLGFAEGKTSITVGAKVKADVVFEHSSASATTQIAEDIRGWAREKMLGGQVRDPKKEMTSSLLKEVREFNQNAKEEDRKLINQFTEEGVDLLVDYYNTKYPERGQIHRVQAPMTLNVRAEESGEEKNARTTIETQEATTQGLSQLLQNNRPPLKVMLTFLQRETSDSEFLVDRGRHSIPLLITDDKLILLRDEGNPATPKSLAVVAQNLGLCFVQQKEPAQYAVETEKGPKTKSTSIQGDHSNCNGIAVGILKDLTSEDVAKVSAFEDRYTPLPKMLKYSQSENFILRTYPELANEPVKFDKEGMPQATLIQYVHDNSHQTITSTNQQTGEQEQKEQKTGSRIGDKMDRMRQDMSKLQPEDKGSWAQKILEKRAQDKESQNKVTER
jgi:hypothetical protein